MSFPLRLLIPATLLLASCSQGTADGGSGGGPGGPVFVQFSDASISRVEDIETVKFRVEMDQAHHEDVLVHFTWSGDATYMVDFTIPSAGLLTIGAGDIAVDLYVQIFEDSEGELDEILQLQLQEPENANLGSKAIANLTIVDEDQVLFTEVEPNDAPPSANLVGEMKPGLAFEVSGHIIPGLFDFFRFDCTANTRVDLRLDPNSPSASIVLNLVDANGDLIEAFHGALPGATVKAEYLAAQGETFYLGVAVVNEPTSYVLDVVGL